MRREERVTVQGPVKKPYPDGMSHRGGGGAEGEGGSKDCKTAQPPVRQLLGPAHAETTPAGTLAAAADRTQRPDAASGGTNE